MIRNALIRLIDAYSYFISPFIGDNCRYYPSCSEYSKEALHKHGLFKGCGLTIIRLCSCHPLKAGGFDPVP